MLCVCTSKGENENESLLNCHLIFNSWYQKSRESSILFSKFHLFVLFHFTFANCSIYWKGFMKKKVNYINITSAE